MLLLIEISSILVSSQARYSFNVAAAIFFDNQEETVYNVCGKYIDPSVSLVADIIFYFIVFFCFLLCTCSPSYTSEWSISNPPFFKTTVQNLGYMLQN